MDYLLEREDEFLSKNDTRVSIIITKKWRILLVRNRNPIKTFDIFLKDHIRFLELTVLIK